MTKTFSSPFMYWNGMNTSAASDAAENEFNQYYNQVHVNEVLAHNVGFVHAHRYELAQPDPRGDLGPRWLMTYELTEPGARAYLEQSDSPVHEASPFTPGPPLWQQKEGMWRLIWRRIGEVGEEHSEPSELMLRGMDVPEGTSASELKAFYDFYAEAHAPETMASRNYTRCTMYQVERSFKHPQPGCPRFCAIYSKARGSDTSSLGAKAGMDEASHDAPPAWDNRVVSWRLIYKRFTS